MNYFPICFPSLILFLVYFRNAYQNENTINMIQSDIQSATLTGGHRPAEIAMSYNISTTSSSDCQHSFAKYMVSLRKLETQNNFGHKHFCGGVIIRPDLIITAAHCLLRNHKELHPSSIRVIARTPVRLHKTSNTQIVKVKKIIVHEMFSSSSYADIALLKLQTPIILDKNCADVIRLPGKGVNDSTSCTVLGWGKLYLNGPMANEILQLNVTLRSKEFCELFMLESNNYELCASDITDIEKNPCSGDSGGPLICEGFLTGLVSYGFQCAHGFPTVYTDVYKYSSWIEENNGDSPKNVHVKFWPIFSLLVTFVL